MIVIRMIILILIMMLIKMVWIFYSVNYYDKDNHVIIKIRMLMIMITMIAMIILIVIRSGDRVDLGGGDREVVIGVKHNGSIINMLLKDDPKVIVT